MTIYYSIKADRREVLDFLDLLQATLSDENFDINNNIFFILNDNGKNGKFSNQYTMLDLGYTYEDIVDRLKELTLEEYSETKIDRDDTDPQLLYVFGKSIKGNCVYIKLKVRNHDKRIVICVSFHYAEWDMTFPFA